MRKIKIPIKTVLHKDNEREKSFHKVCCLITPLSITNRNKIFPMVFVFVAVR